MEPRYLHGSNSVLQNANSSPRGSLYNLKKEISPTGKTILLPSNDTIYKFRQPHNQDGSDESDSVPPSWNSLRTFRENRYSFHWPNEAESDDPTHTICSQGGTSTTPLHIQGTIATNPHSICSIYAGCATAEKNGFTDLVAIKKIRLEDEQFKEKEKFRTEIRLLRNLCHNHIIAFLGSYERGPELGIVMFPVAKNDLTKPIKEVSVFNKKNRGRKDEHLQMPILREYFSCLCYTLHYLHEDMQRPIRHRDIKPDNILVDRRNSVILADFGIAKEYPSKEEVSTSGETDRTVMYAAPEVLACKPRDFKSDIFSLGCVFLEMATVILGETLENMDEVLQNRTSSQPPKKTKYGRCTSEIRTWIDSLRTSDASDANFHLANDGLSAISRMLSYCPEDRPDICFLVHVFGSSRLKPCEDCHYGGPTEQIISDDGSGGINARINSPASSPRGSGEFMVLGTPEQPSRFSRPTSPRNSRLEPVPKIPALPGVLSASGESPTSTYAMQATTGGQSTQRVLSPNRNTSSTEKLRYREVGNKQEWKQFANRKELPGRKIIVWNRREDTLCTVEKKRAILGKGELWLVTASDLTKELEGKKLWKIFRLRIIRFALGAKQLLLIRPE